MVIIYNISIIIIKLFNIANYIISNCSLADHRPVDSDLSSSSTDAQSRLRGTPLSLGSQDGVVPTSTGLPGRTAKFPVGKGNKKDKSSAIEALITQTAMFAPRLAHTKVPSDNRGFKPRDGTVLTSGAESDAISVHSKVSKHCITN